MLTVRTVSDAIDRSVVPGQGSQPPACVDVPDLNFTRICRLTRLPGTDRQLGPNRVKGDGEDLARELAEFPQLPAVGGGREPGSAVQAPRGETPAVGAESERRHGRRMPGEAQPGTLLAH